MILSKIRYSSEQWGFTFSELIIVIAIVGILAAIAIPSYKSYIKRAQITEGFIVSEGIRSEIGIHVWEKNVFQMTPKCLRQATLVSRLMTLKVSILKPMVLMSLLIQGSSRLFLTQVILLVKH